ncbi:MAG: peptidylprolyl isomerase [Pirellulales bacterium]|nr:peptidylprolyl isomerase [Pirellulales bacterium]
MLTYPLRRPRFEPLEIRQVLSVAPTLAAISDVVLTAGAPLHIALDGFDADGDALTYSVTTTNSAISTSIPTGNRSMKITVLNEDGTIAGDMIFQLFEDRAPETTARIIALAQSGFYDDLIFHRVAEYTDGTPFVIQGGDPLGDGTGGSDLGEFDDEFHTQLLHTSAGVLSMAKSSDDTNDSQFFITGAAARHLDFNHSVFGFLTEGDAVREAIQDTAVDANSKPLVDVVMESVEVFYDHENGVLMLSAPEGTTGEADVTVTVSDGNGGVATRTFHVTIQADTQNDTPYLLDIPDIQTTANTPVTVTLPGFDVEGDSMYFAGYVYPASDNMDITIASGTGVTTVTPKNGAAGVFGILVGVRTASSTSASWDTQAVPVFVSPAAPTSIQLVASADTGSSSTDGVTRLNNSSGNALRFRVDGVVSGAEVSIYADGEFIGKATATGTSVVVITDGALALSDGAHQITAIQRLVDQAIPIGNRSDTITLISQTSAALAITIDRTVPAITSDALTTGAVGAAYAYNVESDAETAGEATYSLGLSPAGMLIDTATGQITWTPSDTQGATHSITVVVADRAGNEKSQSFNIVVNQAPDIWTIGNKLVQEGQLLTFQVVATDPDGNLPLVFTLDAGAPEGASIDPLTGQFAWTPTEAQGPGAYDISIRVTDAVGATDNQKIRVTVSEENLVPLLAGIADRTVNEGQLLAINASATDADLPANVLTFSLAPGAPAGAAINPTTGRLTWRPSETQGGATHAITVRVTDSAGASDEKTFHVAVNEVDDPPAFASVGEQLALPGMAFRVRAEAADPDVPTNPVRYALGAGAPAGMTIDPTTGVISWNVPDDFPLGTLDVAVLAREVLPGGSEGLGTSAVLRVIVASIDPTAFDAALSRARFAAPLPVVGLAPESLLFDPQPVMRFVRVATSPPRDESPLGLRLIEPMQGGGRVNRDGESLEGEENSEDGDAARSDRPTAEVPRVRARVAKPAARGDDTAEDAPTEAVLSELLDAALAAMAQEQPAAEAVDAPAA